MKPDKKLHNKVVKLRESGYSFGDIAKLVDRSKTRVFQIYHKYKGV